MPHVEDGLEAELLQRCLRFLHLLDRLALLLELTNLLAVEEVLHRDVLCFRHEQILLPHERVHLLEKYEFLRRALL